MQVNYAQQRIPATVLPPVFSTVLRASLLKRYHLFAHIYVADFSKTYSQLRCTSPITLNAVKIPGFLPVNKRVCIKLELRRFYLCEVDSPFAMLITVDYRSFAQAKILAVILLPERGYLSKTSGDVPANSERMRLR